jgi:hypothetical protein
MSKTAQPVRQILSAMRLLLTLLAGQAAASMNREILVVAGPSLSADFHASGARIRPHHGRPERGTASGRVLCSSRSRRLYAPYSAVQMRIVRSRFEKCDCFVAASLRPAPTLVWSVA